MKLMFNQRYAPYLGPLFIEESTDLWMVKQVALLSGTMRMVKMTKDSKAMGTPWHELGERDYRIGLMKNGNLAMGALANCPLDQFIAGTLALARIAGKRTWTEPSFVSTQFSLPYVTNGHCGYVVRRRKLSLDLELRHNKRNHPITTPTITLSKGGHLLVPIQVIRAKLEAGSGILSDPFAIKQDKNKQDYVEL